MLKVVYAGSFWSSQSIISAVVPPGGFPRYIFPPCCFALRTLRPLRTVLRFLRTRFLKVFELKTIYLFTKTIIRVGSIEFAKSFKNFLFSRRVVPGLIPYRRRTPFTPSSVSLTEIVRFLRPVVGRPFLTAQAILLGQLRGLWPYAIQTGQYIVRRYWHSILLCGMVTLLSSGPLYVHIMKCSSRCRHSTFIFFST